jgi:type IV pilus assembly protein PilB
VVDLGTHAPGAADRTVPTSPRLLAEAHGLPYVDLARMRVEKEAADAIPFDVLSRSHAAPYKLEGDILHVAIADPSDLQLIDDIRAMSPFRVEFGVGALEDIDFQLRQIARGH